MPRDYVAMARKCQEKFKQENNHPFVLRHIEHLAHYNANPKQCLYCNIILDYKQRQNDFCSRSCAAKRNNKLKNNTELSKNKCCLYCLKESSSINIYCSRKCQSEHQYTQYIEQWKNNKITGLNSLNVVTNPIKRYLREKYNDCCCLCGWAKPNKKTGKIPLVADHIDGNSYNNSEENLQLICPNCDAISETYCALNTGNG